MSRFFSAVGQTYNKLLVVLNYVSVICIFLMSFLIFADVVGRYCFNHPIPGTTEVVKCSIIVIVFFGISYTLQQKRHIRTTIILDRMSPIGKVWFDLMAYFLCAIIFFVLAIFASQAGWESLLVREFDGVQVKVPVYPSRLVIVLGSGLLVIQAVVDFLGNLKEELRHYWRKD